MAVMITCMISSGGSGCLRAFLNLRSSFTDELLRSGNGVVSEVRERRRLNSRE
jgi:hypothetical protein